MPGQLPNQDKVEKFVDLHKMSLSAETSLNKDDQQIDQAENKLPFICGGKWMKHQSVRWRGSKKRYPVGMEMETLQGKKGNTKMERGRYRKKPSSVKQK